MSSGFDETATHLGTLDAGFQPFVIYFVNAVRAAGVPLIVISGRRSALTNQAVGGAERSLHLYGFAFDVQVMGMGRDALPERFWTILGVFWESMGGRWGGRFDPPDVNHFDAGFSARV